MIELIIFLPLILLIIQYAVLIIRLMHPELTLIETKKEFLMWLIPFYMPIKLVCNEYKHLL